MGIRGTFHLAVDTNYIFHRSFFAKYKEVEFKYVKGENGYADCIVADIYRNNEVTYALITELISAFSFSKNRAFIIDTFSSNHDQYRGKLTDREPGVTRKRMMQIDFKSENLAGDLGITAHLPKIENNNETQSNLARLYRLGRAEEYVNFISSFLFYYHIIDHPCDAWQNVKGESVAAKYINSFCLGTTEQHHKTLIDHVNNNRVFDKNSVTGQTQNQGELGNYIKDKVRHSVGHIIRHEWHDAHGLIIDSFEQNAHFYYLKELLRTIARDKLKKHHGFENYCGEDIFIVHPEN